MLKKTLPKLHLTVKDKTIISLMMIPALFCLCLGLYYWVRLIGVFAGDTWRFDLMPWYWRAMSCSLAVIYPIAACGLWTASRWGIILWAAAALYESGAYIFYAADFGRNWLILLLHIIFFSFYGLLLYALRENKNREGQTMVEY